MTANASVQQPRPRKIVDVLAAGTDYLSRHGVEHPRLALEHLLGHVLRCPRLELYLRFDTRLTDEQLADSRQGVQRLAAGEPLQYVIGETDFMGYPLRVDGRALIPRPETEVLVDEVLRFAPLWANARPVVADIGTGSGCIAISLALKRRGAVQAVACDSDAAALTLARENAQRHGGDGDVAFVRADLLQAMRPGSLGAAVSNLPYITTDDWSRLPKHIRDHEPRAALDGGADGLSLIRRLVPEAAAAIAPGGFLFLEVGAGQPPEVRACLEANGFVDVRVVRDLAGRERVVCGTRRTP